MNKKPEGNKYFAHMLSASDQNIVKIIVDNESPIEKREFIEGKQGTYHGNVEITDNHQIAQLGGLGKHEGAAWEQFHAVPIEESMRIYPEVKNLATSLIEGGFKLGALTEGLEIETDKPEDVIKIVREFATPQGADPERKV